MKPRVFIMAVDFDDTLFYTDYPYIEEPNMEIINLCKKWKASGRKVILWTCREGKELEEAVEACRSYGLEFDAVNDNLDSGKRQWGNNPRKIFADYYIDDKAVSATNIDKLKHI